MANVERKSALAKAPALDVVTALTAPTEPGRTPETTFELPRANTRMDGMPEPSAGAADRVEEQPTASPATGGGEERPALPVPAPQPPLRRGPGRPRSRRRMEPFSSKIDIELRDRVDEYIAEHDTTFVELLDEALRAKIAES